MSQRGKVQPYVHQQPRSLSRCSMNDAPSSKLDNVFSAFCMSFYKISKMLSNLC